MNSEMKFDPSDSDIGMDSFQCHDYVREAVQNVMNYLKKRGEGLSAKAVTPMTSGYHPEIDITPEL